MADHDPILDSKPAADRFSGFPVKTKTRYIYGIWKNLNRISWNSGGEEPVDLDFNDPNYQLLVAAVIKKK